jgi:two-component sensor histidine kinase
MRFGFVPAMVKPVIHRQFQTDGEQFFTEFGAEGWQPFLQISNGKCEVLRPVPFDWLFSCNGKTILLEANSNQVVPVFPTEFNHTTVTHTTYGTWIGTEKGLVFVVQNGIRYFPDSEVPYPWSVVEDSQQRMWFLNYLHPIQRFDGQRIETVTGYAEEMIRQQQVAKVANIIPNQDGWYYGALRDKRGNLWMPNANGVLWNDGKRFQFLVRPTLVNRSSLAFCLLEDPKRNVVLQGGEGLVHIFENQPPFQTTSITQKEGMNVKPIVSSMALEKSGVYWFGGRSILSRYDVAQKQWREYSQENKRLTARGILGLEFDNRGTLWVATLTQGLTYLDARRDTIRNVEAPELREPANSVIQLDQNHLLIGSQRNLYIMDLRAWYDSKKVVLKCFNHHNGFLGIEPMQNGLYKDSRGQIWVMAGAALSVIDPKKIDLRAGQLRTYATKLNGQRLPFAQLAKDSVFALPFGTGDVRVEFESVGEDKSFQSQYSYFVEGLTDGWTPWQEEPVATLTHLASGTYTIHIKSRTGGTEANNSQEAILRFSVRVWPWQSPYFPYYASALLMLVVGYSVYYRWQNNRERQQAEAQRQQAQRQAEKAEAEIVQQTQAIKVLEVQTAQAQMNPHFIFNVLGTLQSLVYHNETVKANENIVKFGNLMRSYLSASLSLDGTRESLERGMITLEQEIKLLQMYIDFEQLQYRDRFEANIHVSPDLSPDFYRILPLLIQPFVENAIKHGVLPNLSQKGQVWVRFWLEEDETLVCQIEDNGIGREASSKRKEEAIQTHRSEGTNLVRKRAELLKQLNYFIDIQTTDRPEGGTSVLVKINDRYNDL